MGLMQMGCSLEECSMLVFTLVPVNALRPSLITQRVPSHTNEGQDECFQHSACDVIKVRKVSLKGILIKLPFQFIENIWERLLIGWFLLFKR